MPMSDSAFSRGCLRYARFRAANDNFLTRTPPPDFPRCAPRLAKIAPMIALRLFAVLCLVGMNAFFSAAEFSLVAVRLSRVRQLVEMGDPRAKIVELLLGDLSRVVSGVQVGITISSLLLGYLGEITLAGILDPLVAAIPRPWTAIVAHGTALVLAFGLLTVLQVVLGELVPKSLSLARAERVALLVARPVSLVPGNVSLGH